MELEFGKQKKYSLERECQRQKPQKQRSSYQQRTENIQLMMIDWWNVLGVQETDTKANIKSAQMEC